MGSYKILAANFITAISLTFCNLSASEKSPSENMKKIMDEAKYEHAMWGLYVKDLQTGDVLYDLNSNKLFSPASTTKLFSVAALLHTYGDDYRFKTPVYAVGKVENGQLNGNLVLVAQGDLTMGGRQPNADTIAYTKLDHINANEIPGVILTKENPLHGLNELAKQVYQKGIRQINGDVLIDESLFDSTEVRGMMLSPIFLNENLIDIVINPTEMGKPAEVSWRPMVPGYTVKNEIKTVEKGETVSIEITADKAGHHILVQGTVPIDQKNLVRTFSIKDPGHFARSAFIQALQDQQIKINLPKEAAVSQTSQATYKNLEPIALWVSPPLSEYAKLILKVSHNLGANLVPMLLAVRQGNKTYDDGMLLIGEFIKQKVKLAPDTYVMLDAAGGNENRFTPIAEVQLLDYMHKLPAKQFERFYDALPILGVDGSLEDFAKNTSAVGKVRAKPGTGVSFNLTNRKFFLITQALGGYIEGKNKHLLAYMVVVNNGKMPTIEDIFPIFEDVSLISSEIYDRSNLMEHNQQAE